MTESATMNEETPRSRDFRTSRRENACVCSALAIAASVIILGHTPWLTARATSLRAQPSLCANIVLLVGAQAHATLRSLTMIAVSMYAGKPAPTLL